jgi:hypothetical protein
VVVPGARRNVHSGLRAASRARFSPPEACVDCVASSVVKAAGTVPLTSWLVRGEFIACKKGKVRSSTASSTGTATPTLLPPLRRGAPVCSCAPQPL